MAQGGTTRSSGHRTGTGKQDRRRWSTSGPGARSLSRGRLCTGNLLLGAEADAVPRRDGSVSRRGGKVAGATATSTAHVADSAAKGVIDVLLWLGQAALAQGAWDDGRAR